MSQSGTFGTGGGGGAITQVDGGANINTDQVGTVVTVNLDDDVITNSYQTSAEEANLTMISNSIIAGGTDPIVDIDFTTQGGGLLSFKGIPAGWANTQWKTVQGAVQTVNATPTPILTISLEEGTMVTIKAYINGLRSTFADSLGAEALVTVYRPAAGDVTIVGFPEITINSTSTSTVTATVDTGTQDVSINVVGVAAQTWNWVTTYNFMTLSTNL